MIRVFRRLRVAFGTEAEKQVGFTVSLSHQEIGIESRVGFDVGTPINGSIRLPGQLEVVFEGVVRGYSKPDPLRTGRLEGELLISIANASPAYREFLSASGLVERPSLPPRASIVPPAMPRRFESRKQGRTEHHLEARYEFFVGELGERHHLSEVLDISEGGCQLTTGNRHEKAFSRIFVHFKLPSGERIRVLAVIRWAKPPPSEAEPGTMGVRFEGGQVFPVAFRQLLEEQPVEPRRTEPPREQTPTVNLGAPSEVVAAARGQLRERTTLPPRRRDNTASLWRQPDSGPPAKSSPPEAVVARPADAGDPTAREKPSETSVTRGVASQPIAEPPDPELEELLRDYVTATGPKPSAEVDSMLKDYVNRDPS